MIFSICSCWWCLYTGIDRRRTFVLQIVFDVFLPLEFSVKVFTLTSGHEAGSFLSSRHSCRTTALGRGDEIYYTTQTCPIAVCLSGPTFRAMAASRPQMFGELFTFLPPVCFILPLFLKAYISLSLPQTSGIIFSLWRAALLRSPLINNESCLGFAKKRPLAIYLWWMSNLPPAPLWSHFPWCLRISHTHERQPSNKLSGERFLWFIYFRRRRSFVFLTCKVIWVFSRLVCREPRVLLAVGQTTSFFSLRWSQTNLKS